jgi:hypothetical protein
LSIGQTINASVELESREYNGRWYTEARAWKIDKNNAAAYNDGPPPPAEEPFVPDGNNTADDLPF